MSECELIDTFATFLAFWNKAQNKSMDAQIETWASEYMSCWPELLEKQLRDYSDKDIDWRQIARSRVFPFLNDRLPIIKQAHENLSKSAAKVWRKAQGSLGFESDIIFVIYVGIGCGAGWATSLGNKLAILFGLENIAECGWSKADTIEGLIAHEIGHIVHKIWRSENGMNDGSGSWWQLYSEGFAKRCEHLILGKESWHESFGINDSDWLNWCKENKKWLARESLKTAENNQSVRPFFGHWFDLKGKRQCGYFLGHEIIKELEKEMTLKEIAVLNEIEKRLKNMLVDIAGAST